MNVNRGCRKIFKILIRAVFFSVFIMLFIHNESVMAATNAKIHFVTLNATTNAIVVECNGRFGMIDSGEDSDKPDGSNLFYPIRYGTSTIGYEEKVINYLYSIGVNSSNFDFYIGTHPHSDHIGSADEIIRIFKPKTVYIGEYTDDMISNPTNLWDNLYVYDCMLDAAKDVGATIIQSFDDTESSTDDELNQSSRTLKLRGDNLDDNPEDDPDDVPEDDPNDDPDDDPNDKPNDDPNDDPKDPENDPKKDDEPDEEILDGDEEYFDEEGDYTGKSLVNNTVGKSSFILGDGMKITIMNTDVDRYKKWNDANDFSWGVLVEANGKRAFCSGDINNYNGCEDKLLEQLQHVDLLVLGHHGYAGSSTDSYLKGLNPSNMVICGPCINISPQVMDTITEMVQGDSKIFATGQYSEIIDGLAFNFDSSMSNNIPGNYVMAMLNYKTAEEVAYLFRNGKLCDSYWGPVTCNGNRFFEYSYIASKNKWAAYGDDYYYLNKIGDFLTGWNKIDDVWYYMCSDGRILRDEWLNDDDVWYYFGGSGKMYKGWLEKNGRWYYLSDSGRMVTGWKEIDYKWYYFNENGRMVTGWLLYKDNWYFMAPNGEMVTDCWIGKYYLDWNGIWTITK